MIQSLEEYQDAYNQSLEDLDNYWENIAAEFKWKKKWTSIHSGNFIKGNIKWFDGAQLNITENIFERDPSILKKTAIYWEPNNPKDPAVQLSYGELFLKVQRAANAFKDLGVKKGDVVAIYMPMIPETIITSLACARIGAVHSIIFGGFSAQALGSRLVDSRAKLLVTAQTSFRGDKEISLMQIAEEALQEVPQLKNVVVVNNNHQKVCDNYIDFHQKLSEQDDHCPATYIEAEDPFFILYTSGSTGKPKGLVHTAAGYMLWASESFKHVFQYQQDDIFWCTADVGWITGHSYFLYGPMLNQASQIMFEGVPTWPDASRMWQVVEKYNVTHFYTAPTAIRALEACGLEFVQSYQMPSLKVLGSVGEPINQEAWEWYYKNIGKERCEIVDTWWQTETGGIMISNLAGVTKAKPSFATKALPGAEPVLLNEQGQEQLKTEAEGILCIKRPWPGMARTILGDHSRYMETYFKSFPGYYFTGDGARRDDEGDYRISGRIDDVINVSGHRISTAEVENFINEHSDVIESAVIGASHNVKGQSLWAYAICSNKNKDSSLLKVEINKLLTEKIGSFSKLEHFFIVNELPKTRSGKIMRRVLRKASQQESDFGDLSTLLNPNVVGEIQELVRQI